MTNGLALRRKIVDRGIRLLALICVIVALVPLVSILYTAVVRGGASLVRFPPGDYAHPTFYPQFLYGAEALPCTPGFTPGCQFGGIGPAIEGTLVLLALGSLIAMPLGVLAGIYLSEFGRYRWWGRWMSFLVDVLTGVPSIVVGVFVYSLFLYFEPSIVFSALSGSVALALVMLPVVVRTTEESLRLVPRSVREASLALGLPTYRTTLRVVLPTGASAVVTGALLAVARAGGEAAPLLLTAFGNQRGFVGLNRPTEAVPPLIYTWGGSPFGNWIQNAWGAALVLILMMLTISLCARYLLTRRAQQISGGF